MGAWMGQDVVAWALGDRLGETIDIQPLRGQYNMDG
jgi:hypothetical protein